MVPVSATAPSSNPGTSEFIPTQEKMEGGILVEARARQTLNSEWDPIHPPPIDGVYVRDVKNVVYRGGLLTELYRPEWFKDEFPVGHVVHVSLLPGLVTQWHCHHIQRDIVFPVRGYLRIGLYDARPESPTHGKSFALNFNLHRPRYLHIPPGVWHCLRNIGADESVFIVLNDVAFDYENPDDWTLAPDSPALPTNLV